MAFHAQGHTHWVNPGNRFSIWICQSRMAASCLAGRMAYSHGLITLASEGKGLLTKRGKKDTLWLWHLPSSNWVALKSWSTLSCRKVRTQRNPDCNSPSLKDAQVCGHFLTHRALSLAFQAAYYTRALAGGVEKS